jgi:hypothetical protein
MQYKNITKIPSMHCQCVLYGCGTWSLTLREESRLKVFENRVLRIFQLKRDEVTGEWRKLHNEELNDLYCSPNIIQIMKSRKMRRAGHVARMEERRGVHRVLVGKPEGKNHLEDPGVDGRIILKWIFRTSGWGIGWINLARNRDGWLAFENTVMNLAVTQNVENVLTS